MTDDDDDFSDLDDMLADIEADADEDEDEFADLDEYVDFETPADKRKREREERAAAKAEEKERREAEKEARLTEKIRRETLPKVPEGEFRFIMSGHCLFPETANPARSHERCGAVSYANPRKDPYPCPCICHFPGEQYEDEGCSTDKRKVFIVEAPFMGLDEDGDEQYVHVARDGKRVSHVLCGNEGKV
jgi:hypothetical protein